MVQAPVEASAEAAVTTLRAELDTLFQAIDAIDQKAAVVPAALGAIAALFIAPDTTLQEAQIVAMLIGIVTGGVSIGFALFALSARLIDAGPNAQQTAGAVHLHPAAFNRAVAGSLANSVDKMSEITKSKGYRLNVSLVFAAFAIASFAAIRVI